MSTKNDIAAFIGELLFLGGVTQLLIGSGWASLQNWSTPQMVGYNGFLVFSLLIGGSLFFYCGKRAKWF